MSTASHAESAPDDEVAADSPHMPWWRRQLFGRLLRLDANGRDIAGVTADRVQTVDIPTKL
jgi:hypothetical protein